MNWWGRGKEKKNEGNDKSCREGKEKRKKDSNVRYWSKARNPKFHIHISNVLFHKKSLQGYHADIPLSGF